MSAVRRAFLAVAAFPVVLLAQSPAPRDAAPRVGPANGTVIVVGGGSLGPEIYRAFIDAAGGPDALIVDVPNAGGADAYAQDGPGTRGWKQAGAKNVYTLFTKDRMIADADSFVAILKQAGGVWFEGGRQFRLFDAYAGTRVTPTGSSVAPCWRRFHSMRRRRQCPMPCTNSGWTSFARASRQSEVSLRITKPSIGPAR